MAKTRVLIGLGALAALIGVSGCGGSGSYTVPAFPSGTLNFTGKTTTMDTTTAAVTVPLSGGVTVTLKGGESVVIPSGSVPAGTVLASGTHFAIVPAGVGFPAGSTGDPAGSELTINGQVASGVPVGENGLTTLNMALPVTTGSTGTAYTIAFPTTNLSTAVALKSSTRDLTIAEIEFSGKFYILTRPALEIISPIPTLIGGSLPNNGQNAAGTTVETGFGVGNSGRSLLLEVQYGPAANGFAINQSRVVGTNLTAKFTDMVLDAQNVPASGVQLVSFSVGDLP